jgi:hypothetical protein
MLYDGSDIINSYASDLKDRVGAITGLTGKAIYAYTQDEFMNKAKKLLFPAVGIFHAGTATLNPNTRRSVTAEMVFNLIVVDTGKVSMIDGVDSEPTRRLLSLIRQALHNSTTGTQKIWSFISESPFDIGDKDKIAYVQRWSAIVSES